VQVLCTLLQGAQVVGRKNKDETIVVAEGVYLKDKDGVFHAYFRLAGKQFRKSTKTSDLTKAKFLALTWHREAANKADAGEEIESISFARLKRSYLEHIKHEGKFTYHSATAERHLLPFFSKFDDISKIKKKDLLDYVKFRFGRGKTPPTPQTMNRESTVLRQMLRYAIDRGWIKTAPKIDNISERLTRRRRRHFTFDEYRKLYKTAQKRIRELKDNPLTKRQYEQRKLLLDYIILLANTGLRVDEAKTLIWRNVDWESKTLLLEHAGKTKSTRRVIMRAGAVQAIKRMQERRLRFLEAKKQPLDVNEKIVSLPNGTPVVSLKKGFNELLTACGFRYDTIHDKHALTSLRHTFATFRLTTRSGNRASVRALAKQMGTSEKMIERHYGHDVVEDYRDELMY